MPHTICWVAQMVTLPLEYIIPVSYTHLLQYQSQKLKLYLTTEKIMLTLQETKQKLHLLRPASVSYTHLDVYKRQIYPCAEISPGSITAFRLASSTAVSNSNGKFLAFLIFAGILFRFCLLYTSFLHRHGAEIQTHRQKMLTANT